MVIVEGSRENWTLFGAGFRAYRDHVAIKSSVFDKVKYTFTLLAVDIDYGNNYRSPNDSPCSPNGYCPEFEENRFRSFLLVSVDPHKGMTAQGIQSSMETNRIGSPGRVFDYFLISHPNRSIQEAQRGSGKGSGRQG
jgi:hypothetical protein